MTSGHSATVDRAWRRSCSACGRTQVRLQGEIRDLVDELAELRATKQGIEAATDRVRREREGLRRDVAALRASLR